MKNKITPTKTQIAIVKLYWDMFQAEQSLFYGRIGELEKAMSKKTGIKDIEFFQCDGDWVGIGNAERTMKLIQREELE